MIEVKERIVERLQLLRCAKSLAQLARFSFGMVVFSLPPIVQLLDRPLVGRWRIIVIGLSQSSRTRQPTDPPYPNDTIPKGVSLRNARSDDPDQTIPEYLTPSTPAVRHRSLPKTRSRQKKGKGAAESESLGLWVHDCFACRENGKVSASRMWRIAPGYVVSYGSPICHPPRVPRFFLVQAEL